MYKDRDIVAAIVKGGQAEEQAIACLFRKNDRSLKIYIRKMNGTEADAEEIIQEGMLILLGNIKKGAYKSEASVHSYYVGICKRLWLKWYRKNKKMILHATDTFPEAIEEEQPEHMMIKEELKILIEQLFDRLKPKCKEVLSLWKLKYSMKEIAEQTGYANDQVAMNKKNHCMNELRALLEAYPQLREQLRSL